MKHINEVKRKESSRKYYLKNKDRILKYSNEYQLNHKDELRPKIHERYLKHREEILAKNKTIPERYKKYKQNAVKRNVEFLLTLEEFAKLSQDTCVYCGEDGYGVDRIDSAMGYIEGNVVPCCKLCNMMKNKHSVKEFFEHCKKIIENNYGLLYED